MRFFPTELAGVMIVEPDLHQDERGFFTRLACVEEFAAAGISFEPRQTSLSRNSHRHTLRGMHSCTEPEAKLVHCTRGRILDVVFDIRRDSPTFGRSFGIELDAERVHGIYIPPGAVHGFLTLEPATDILYEIDRVYRPGCDFGLRWNDPLFAFPWPAHPAIISARDANYADFGAGRSAPNG
jgi:dTDP-4-dehydrorhamnose 3,5-epimerase